MVSVSIKVGWLGKQFSKFLPSTQRGENKNGEYDLQQSQKAQKASATEKSHTSTVTLQSGRIVKEAWVLQSEGVRNAPVFSRSMSAPPQRFVDMQTDHNRPLQRQKSESYAVQAKEKSKSAAQIIASYQRAIDATAEGTNIYERLANMHLEAAHNSELSDAARSNHFINAIHDLQRAIFLGSESARSKIISTLRTGLQKSQGSREYIVPASTRESTFWRQVDDHAKLLNRKGYAGALVYHNTTSEFRQGELKFHTVAMLIESAKHLREANPGNKSGLAQVEKSYFGIVNERQIFSYFDVIKMEDVKL